MNSYILRSEDKLPKSDYQTIALLLLDKLKQCYDRTVLVDASTGREWTGDEIYESALNLSHYLIKECLMRPQSVVCFLCADSDIHAIAAIGVMSAGGVYCPLPPRSTYREVESAINLIEPSFIVTDQYNYGVAALIAAESMFIKKILIIDEKSVFDINSNLDVIESIFQFERSFLPLPVERSLDDTCALTLISAADGSPNAVIRSNRNLIATATALQSPELKSEDILLITCLHSHTNFGLLLHAINNQVKFVIAERSHCSDEKLISLVNKFQITSAFLTDSQLYFYLNKQGQLSKLNIGWTASAANNGPLSDLITSFKNLRIIHSTPEAGWITTILLSGYDVAKNNNIIGKPVAGVEIKIIDINGESVPFDTMGEVCVRSAQCAKGFYNNVIESERIFTSDGFVRTGDFGFYDRNGMISISGHSGDFIKVDDYYISCEELESILLTRIDVKESAVICNKDKSGREAIKVLVTLKGNHKHDLKDRQSAEEDIRNFINLRVEPRKWVKEGGIEILDKTTESKFHTFTLEKIQEQFV